MSWLRQYRFRHDLTNSIWIMPLAGMVLGIVAARVLYRVDVRLGWRADFNPDALRTVLITLAGVVFTLIVFLNSALLIALQLASAQLSPRVIALLFRDRTTKAALTLFVFTFAFATAAALRVDATAPLLTTRVAGYSSIASMAVFLYLVEHAGKSLRPGSILRRVTRLGRQVIEQVYPRPLTEPSQRHAAAVAPAPTGAGARTLCSSREGVVLAFDIDGLHDMATRADCVIELVPQVGDSIAAGDPLFRIFKTATELSDRALFQSVVIGPERTLEQDPTFAFRIIVDIASKALSPAINDPTTAVLAIDQVHDLLRTVGTRRLDEERLRDASGHVRLVYRTPDWADFVHLAVTEIRHFGSESIQVARRLRAMLEDLTQTLPEERLALLRRELGLLEKSAERAFADPEDRALAQVADPQGVGSRQEQEIPGGTPPDGAQKSGLAAAV